MAKYTCIVDLGFGSSGKGQVAGAWAMQNSPDVAVTANMPNAGHSFRWGPSDAEKVVLTVLPVCAAVTSVKHVLLGPGAVIDLDKLCNELTTIAAIRGAFIPRLIIHPNAMIVRERHREAERELVRIGSTMKGSSEAMIEKIRRIANAPTAGNLRAEIMNQISGAQAHHAFAWVTDINADIYDNVLDCAQRVIVEGSQGHSLGIHTRFYPYTTSRDVSVHQLLADCRIPYNGLNPVVIGVCRTYPIRVANRFDAEGRMIGTSGPHYNDQMELDWQRDLSREPELTTVTKLPRRIFTFSYDQLAEACRVSRPSYLALTFADYLSTAPEWLHSSGVSSSADTTIALGARVAQMVATIEKVAQTPVHVVSWGPLPTDMAVRRLLGDWSRISTL